MTRNSNGRSRKNKGTADRKKQARRTGTKPSARQYEGIVQMNRDGNCYVKVEGLEDGIFVTEARNPGALSGDRVLVRTSASSRARRLEGRIIEILERSTRPFVGVLHTIGSQAWVLMQSRNMPYDISLDVLEPGDKTMPGAIRKMEGRVREFTVDGLSDENGPVPVHPGMKVAAVVTGWPRSAPGPKGRLVEVLGDYGENDTEMHAILAEYGLPYRFSAEVASAADSISEKITASDLKGREDFRDCLTFTIDPADAKDFDDAISYRKLPDGNIEAGVHIADVSWYVRPGSPVDEEARQRGTSVYLVDRTVPMLPEKLSNKLCSLRPGEDKLTFSAVFVLTPQAKIVSRRFCRTVICSDYRFAYETAQQIIDLGARALDTDLRGGADGTEEDGGNFGVTSGKSIPQHLKAAILGLWDLASILRKKRFEAGAFNFDKPELKVICDAQGRPVDVVQHESKEANWLIEEFMLLANRNVAEFVARGKSRTFVYRVHDQPNPEKLEGLGRFASTLGYKADFTDADKVSSSVKKLLGSAREKPEFASLQMVALRAMAKAVYSTDNIGHYGLAFKFYTHFTSPIRRYPDLLVHRLLATYLEGGASPKKEWYEQQCVHASQREQLSVSAERDSVKYKTVEFMREHIDEDFTGHVSGLTEWGMYVEVEPTKIEGMVPLRTISSDYFSYDEDHYRIVGRRSGKVYKLGDQVRVRVKDANLEQRMLDYELID